MERKSGILMPISSLPSNYGIGTFGKEAYKFADFLAAAGQKAWQLLPLGPTSYGDSPYASFSTFAGNPYFIDLDLLIEDGLLKKAEVEAVDWGSDPMNVDYGKIYYNRFDILRLACARGWDRDAAEITRFREQNAGWLPDYALFMALKGRFDGAPWSRWPEPLRRREPAALARAARELSDAVWFWKGVQYLFFAQWGRLKRLANERGVSLIGDLPIYAAEDSADVWAHPEQFQMDAALRCTVVAGCPPDGFSADGQRWGNPLFAWDRMAADGYRWWMRRIAFQFRLYDVVRIDHFRGLESYFSIPAGANSARAGKWMKGPGKLFFDSLKPITKDKLVIAEDLGNITQEVRELVDYSGFPGMRVLQFAFLGDENSPHLPHNYAHNTVAYTGTHDNSPLALWKDEAAPEDIAYAREYLGLNDEEGFNWGLIRGGMSSVARLFVAQMQDYLELGLHHRTNVPGTQSGNWQWRLLPGEATPALARRIRHMTEMYGR